ncbi:MAG: protogloblin ApPgb [Firmicutes bacterium]|nr:protogloblin ApPgb [Bacillota bacterium]
MATMEIPGYRYGDAGLDPSPVSVAEFERMKRAALLTAADEEALRRAGAVLSEHVEELLDVWYGFVGANDFLLAYFSGPGGPDARYLGQVRRRFLQWVLDTCRAKFDETWLAYQHEIGRRHYDRKNATDGVEGAPPHVHFRYLVPLIYPIFATVRPFLEREESDPDMVERMHQAWLKAVILSVTLWSYPYLREGAF